MADFDNNMTGVLFKSDKKTKETDRDYEGRANIDGKNYWVSAWINTGKESGAKFMKLSFRLKEAKVEVLGDPPEEGDPF